MKTLLKPAAFLILLLSAFITEGQKKTSKKNTSPKVVKFITPTPVPPDELKATFSEQPHVFVWQLEKDTTLPASVLCREVVEILPDTVVFTRFYTKNPTNYHPKYYTDHGASEDNNLYDVMTEKAHYTIYYDTLSVWNAATKKYDKYEVSHDSYMMGLGKLVNLKTKRKYKRDEIYNTAGTSE